MSIKGELYRRAINYIGKCNEEYKGIYTEKLKNIDNLTYRNPPNGKAYLIYGQTSEWEKLSRYEVIDNAIQKLAMYEDKERKERLRKEMEKKKPYMGWIPKIKYIRKKYKGICIMWHGHKCYIINNL